MSAPLSGVLVLDLSRVLAGPFCTMMLADLGARVIKVEHPQNGDVTRGWGPPYHPASGMSAYFLSVNRNKESIALDLARKREPSRCGSLARRADVLVENFPPGGLEKFGLSPKLCGRRTRGWSRLPSPDTGARVRRPRSRFRPARAGRCGAHGDHRIPEAGATKVGVAVSDLLAGCYAAIGILAALTARERTGRGAHVETDLFSATLASLSTSPNRPC